MPKCGGRFITKAFVELNIPVITIKNHGRIGVGEKQYTFTSIRRPDTWYQSYFLQKVGRSEWNLNQPFQRFCKADDFKHFIDRVLEYWPGWYSTQLDEYVGNFDAPSVDAIVYLEDLYRGLEKVLMDSGEGHFPASQIARTRNVFKGKYDKFDIAYAPGQLRQIYETEKDVYDCFYPNFEVDDETSKGEISTINSDVK
jgi:hypothetical protein